MLESLGYREVPERARRRPDPLQHLLDPREGRRPLRRPPPRGQGAQAARPGARDRRRRLLGAVGQGAGLPPVPVRRRRLRPRPGPQAGRVPDLRLAHRPGLLRVRGLHRPPAAEARARRPGVDADLRRLQLPLLVLHRPVHARARGLAAARRAGRGGPPAGRRRRHRDHAARPERQRLRPRPAAGARDVRAAARASSTRSTGVAPHPLHEPAPEGHARGRHPRPRRARRRLRAHPPAAAGRLVADPQGDAPHLHARALPGPRRADPRARPGRRAHDRHHRRLPGRDRGRLRRDARGRRGGRLRRRVHVHLLAAPRDRGGRRSTIPSPHEEKVERMQRLVEVVQRRARERAQRFVGRTMEVLVEGAVAHRPEPAARPHAPQQGGQLRRPRPAGRVRRRRDPRGDEPDAGRRAGQPARAGRLPSARSSTAGALRTRSWKRW